MTMPDLLAIESISSGAFHLYRVAILASGLLLTSLGGWGFGAARHARALSGAAGIGLIAYTAYLWVFFDANGIYEIYPWIFAGPLLVVGYHFYTRASDREADEAARVAFEREREQRRAARAAEQDPDS